MVAGMGAVVTAVAENPTPNRVGMMNIFFLGGGEALAPPIEMIEERVLRFVKQRNVEAVRAEMESGKDTNCIPLFVVHSGTLEDMIWFFEKGFASIDYQEKQRLDGITLPAVNYLAGGVDWSGPRALPKLRYLIEAKADIECKSGVYSRDESSVVTPLGVAILCNFHAAIKTLLLAGAKTTYLDLRVTEKLRREWFPLRNRCRSAICAFLWCTRRGALDFRLPRDVADLVAREMWGERFSDCWLLPAELQ